MTEMELKKFMNFNKAGETVAPMFVASINGKFILAAYQGILSKFDILIKYRQKVKGKWSRIRTPKHVHWAVDVLIKMHKDPKQTKKFLDFLISTWSKTEPIKSKKDKEKILNLENLLKKNQSSISQYSKLNKKGEYSVAFLALLGKLLMIQEKTNLETAYMFKNLLDALKQGEDIFKIISIATHVGK